MLWTCTLCLENSGLTHNSKPIDDGTLAALSHASVVHTDSNINPMGRDLLDANTDKTFTRHPRRTVAFPKQKKPSGHQSEKLFATCGSRAKHIPLVMKPKTTWHPTKEKNSTHGGAIRPIRRRGLQPAPQAASPTSGGWPAVASHDFTAPPFGVAQMD